MRVESGLMFPQPEEFGQGILRANNIRVDLKEGLLRYPERASTYSTPRVSEDRTQEPRICLFSDTGVMASPMELTQSARTGSRATSPDTSAIVLLMQFHTSRLLGSAQPGRGCKVAYSR